MCPTAGASHIQHRHHCIVSIISLLAKHLHQFCMPYTTASLPASAVLLFSYRITRNKLTSIIISYTYCRLWLNDYGDNNTKSTLFYFTSKLNRHCLLKWIFFLFWKVFFVFMISKKCFTKKTGRLNSKFFSHLNFLIYNVLLLIDHKLGAMHCFLRIDKLISLFWLLFFVASTSVGSLLVYRIRIFCSLLLGDCRR